MAAIHEALQALGPTAFADVATSDTDLASYLKKTFDHALLLVDSVPPPPSPTDSNISSSATRPRSASAVSLSSARSAPAAPDREALQGAWGKPVKLSAKENPLGVSVYKLAGQDGKGAWFARRSVHEGLGFEAWRDGLRKELPLGWTDEEPGAIVRSIQGQRAVEERRVEGVGDLAGQSLWQACLGLTERGVAETLTYGLQYTTSLRSSPAHRRDATSWSCC